MKQFKTFKAFYPYYLSEHKNLTCRRLHFVGSILGLISLTLAGWTLNAWWLLLAPISGYSLAWVGHFFFEHNKPATFDYPLYSFIGDWVMFAQVITGKVKI
jgi:hypothetical protein